MAELGWRDVNESGGVDFWGLEGWFLCFFLIFVAFEVNEVAISKMGLSEFEGRMMVFNAFLGLCWPV